MKIGIVTIWDAFDNYGGMLQTFALQRYLRNQGQDAFVIRYRLKRSRLGVIKSFVKAILVKVGLLNRTCSEKRRDFAINKAKERKFDDFRNKNIALSEKKYTSLFDIQKHYPKADVYITGSDQVWGRSLRDKFEPFFFLDFGSAKTKKIAYAASFGSSTFPCVNETLFKRLVGRFDKVSVREKEGLAICSDKGIKAERCIDSTFLLNEEVYESLMEPCKHKSPFAFFYTVNIANPEDIYWNDLLTLLKKKSLKPLVTTASGYESAQENFPGAEYDYATVGEWLSNVKNADVIFTSSFHGLAFVLQFKKNFICLPLKGRSQRGNGRLVDLLTLCGLQNRYAKSFDEVCKLMDEPIDYAKVDDSALRNLIISSKMFLEF